MKNAASLQKRHQVLGTAFDRHASEPKHNCIKSNQFRIFDAANCTGSGAVLVLYTITLVGLHYPVQAFFVPLPYPGNGWAWLKLF